MIREITISNFQSLRKAKVRLGRFTVITGPTGSGKSAFVRAARMLAFNARGTSYITRGEKTAQVTAIGDEIEQTGLDDDRWSASITRGGKDQYQLAVGMNQRTYTKLAGKVPEAVLQVLGLGEINFAGQFDRPYLLDSTGSEVARVLGRLTNVTLLYRAAQEANRRRLAAAAELKTRQADLAALTEQASQFADLPRQASQVSAAEQALARFIGLDASRDRLGALIAARDAAAHRLDQLRCVPPPPPSLDELEKLAEDSRRLGSAIGHYDQAIRALGPARASERAATSTAVSCQQELAKYTAQWGVCETCGQPVRKDHGHQEGMIND